MEQLIDLDVTFGLLWKNHLLETKKGFKIIFEYFDNNLKSSVS